jgi:hypothetical protein
MSRTAALLAGLILLIAGVLLALFGLFAIVYEGDSGGGRHLHQVRHGQRSTLTSWAVSRVSEGGEKGDAGRRLLNHERSFGKNSPQ